MTNSHPNTSARWLSIVGIGEDGGAGLSPQAREAIESAEVIFGGARHLSLAAPLIRGEARTWKSPLADSIADIVGYRGRATAVCVLASGDPFQHGVGSVLARQISADEVLAIPTVSAFSLAAARLLWPLQSTTLVSFCGRPIAGLRPYLQPGTRILALTSGASTPAAIADLLRANGFGTSRMTVLEALGSGGARERARTTVANQFQLTDIDPLNTVAIEVTAEDAATRVLAQTPGLADELFEHDGQITKREIRALTLSSLAPRRGETLWDIGAGSGSVAIEWMLADPSLSAVAIERRSDRASRIRRNAEALGVPDLAVVEGDAPEVLSALEPPDAIFIGGGTTTAGVIETAQLKLRARGRLVINGVTLETEAVLIGAHARHGGKLIRIEVQRADPVGGFMTWHPAKPITQWTWDKC
jgi:precorrin-6Y C5,15-methyltransferase (decarboxylating)